jgi:hypothetical protein
VKRFELGTFNPASQTLLRIVAEWLQIFQPGGQSCNGIATKKGCGSAEKKEKKGGKADKATHWGMNVQEKKPEFCSQSRLPAVFKES